MICCYLLASKRVLTATAAIQLFQQQRGLMTSSTQSLLNLQSSEFLPSQLRFLRYFEIYLQRLDQETASQALFLGLQGSSSAGTAPRNVEPFDLDTPVNSSLMAVHRPKVYKLECIRMSKLPIFNQFKNFVATEKSNEDRTIWICISRSNKKLFYAKNIDNIETNSQLPNSPSAKPKRQSAVNPVEFDCHSTLMSGDITIEFYYNSYANVSIKKR
jgi:hypothetical protein